MGDFCSNEWNLVEISGCKPQIIKYIAEEETVTCLLCDMISMKCETMSRTELFSRAKQRNINLQLEEDKILNLITKTKASEYKLEEEFDLHVKYYISGYPYRFMWHLVKVCPEEFNKYLTAPLLCALKNSQEQIQELQDLLKKKDEEIAGYKLSGATLIRKHLETTPFDAKDFPKRQDFSFVNSQSVSGIYNLCSVSQIPESSKNATKPTKVPKSPPGTSNVPLKSPRRSRLLQKRPKDFKMLYEEQGSSQEMDADSTDNFGVSAETPPPNPKIKKRLNL